MFFFLLYFQKRYICKTCGATRGSLLQIEKYMKVHQDETIMKCKEQGMVCNRKYHLKGSLRTHVQTVHKPLKLEVRNYTKDENVTCESYVEFVNRTSKKQAVLKLKCLRLFCKIERTSNKTVR